MAEIRSILHRRTDLSTFIVHLTRRMPNYGPQDALVDIARSGRLEAGTALAWAKAQDDRNDRTKQSQRAVCFSETPLEHINLMIGDIQGRRVVMEPYGVALTKLKARKLGINPVWYVDCTGGADSHNWALSRTLDYLRDQAVRNADEAHENFHGYTLAKLSLSSSRWEPGVVGHRRSSGGNGSGATLDMSTCPPRESSGSFQKRRSIASTSASNVS